ncbi:hypothetical protein TL16_g07283 [Triparma laevis f. inornata]|uniref:Uncharacterized protein n=1 Tax=Triparma laevis f. inornata TaxID=1714386 RepID=A0A9W7EFN6_9STRA|nr:hypothetical protein TL16_g07283 [Triparma laevis f. inornata]
MLFTPGTSQSSNPNKTYQKKRPPNPKDVTDVEHWFEGDGGVVALQFGSLNEEQESGEDSESPSTPTTPLPPSLLLRLRLTRTSGFLNERKLGHKRYSSLEPLRTSPQSTDYNDYPLPFIKHHFLQGLNKKRRNTSNTNIIYWAGKLLTLWEGGLPYKIDPLGLGTSGKSQLGAVLKSSDSFGGSSRYSIATDTMAFYSVEQDPKKSTITVYEFDEDFKLRNGKDNIFGKAGFGGGCEQYEIDGFVIINDLCITKNYYVTTSVGVEIDGLKYNLFKDPKSSIKRLLPFSKIYLLNKMKKEVVSVEVKNDEFGDLRNFQIANSYEDEEGRIIIDGVRSHSDSGVKTRVGNVSEKVSKSAERSD